MSLDTALRAADTADCPCAVGTRPASKSMNGRRVTNLVATGAGHRLLRASPSSRWSLVLGTVIARASSGSARTSSRTRCAASHRRTPTGGIYHAIVGTVQQVGIATLIAVPLALLAAIYLVEYGRGRLAKTISFFVDVMTGLPSIVAGLFIYTLCILTLGGSFAGIYGALALAILMLPVVVRSTEEMLKLVPNELRESSYALGVARWRTILKIVVPTALPGIMTGIMLGVARVTGETAPLLLTTFFTTSHQHQPVRGRADGAPAAHLRRGDPRPARRHRPRLGRGAHPDRHRDAAQPRRAPGRVAHLPEGGPLMSLHASSARSTARRHHRT